MTSSEKEDPTFEIDHSFWVHEKFFASRLSRRRVRSQTHMLVARRISRSTDERTVISCVIPFSAISYGWILTLTQSAEHSAILVAFYNSLCVDYNLRNKLSQPSIPLGVFCQIPIRTPSDITGADSAFIVRRVLELTYNSHSMQYFAQDLGYPGTPFLSEDGRRGLLRAELDAKIAKLYGLTHDQLLDPADIYGPTFPSETFRVLKKNEIAKYGEFRTARLVLDAWDRMERGELTC